MACKCITKLARSQLPSASPKLLHHGLHVHLQSHSITACKCASKLAPFRPPDLLDHSCQVHTIMASKCISELAGSRSRSVSLSSLEHGLQVYLQICSITASKCISKLVRSWPGSVSLCSPHRHFQAHPELLSSTACSQFQFTMCGWVTT